MLFKSIRNKRGMTLMEIMIVLAIIGSLMALLLPQIQGALNRSRMKQTKIAISQIVQAINNYQIDCGKFPATLDNLSKGDAECSNWGPDPYLKRIPKDAWNQEFSYEITNGSYMIRSPGYKGKEITSEDLN
jgi:general secretion pathway protein G